MTEAYRAGSGEPLVLLHGFTASWRVWRPVLPALAAEHDVYAPTLAGHRGGAPLADDCPPTALSLTDALERQLDELGIDHPHVAGNSLGGWIALELARRGRARSVVALSPAGAWRTHADIRRLSFMIRAGHMAGLKAGPRTRAALRRPRLRRLALRAALEHGERMPASEIPGLFEDIAGCSIFDAYAASVADEGPISPDGLDRIACPVRIAWGERDRMIPFERYGRPLLEMMPAAEHVTLPGVGHGPMYDDPDLVVRTILEVTSSAPSAQGDEHRAGTGV